MAAQPFRPSTVLFADVSESTKLYETAGDHVAHQAIRQCLDAMRASTVKTGGRVVKTIGDAVLAVFGSADAAAAAAAEMQASVDSLMPVASRKLGLRVGFHSGPVLQESDDVFGDTVNLASRLVAQAQKGQILTSAETAQQLSPLVRGSVRSLYNIQVKGKSEDVQLFELVWRRNDEETTVISTGRPARRPSRSTLRLRHRGEELTRRRDSDSVTIGRDAGCGITIASQAASRSHCTIERRSDKWVLKDHSTNGTFVTLEGDTELMLLREEFILRRHGVITFGAPRDASDEVVEFAIDE